MKRRRQRKKDWKKSPKNKGKNMRRVRRKKTNRGRNLIEEKQRGRLNQKGEILPKQILHQHLILKRMKENRKVIRYAALY